MVGIGIAVLVALAGADSAQAVTITEFDSNPGHVATRPKNIVSGPEGNLWWTEAGLETGLMRMSPNGERLPIIKTKEEPFDLVVAPSGWASWTTVGGYGARSPGGVMTEQPTGYPGGAIVLTPSNEVAYGRDESGNGVICRGEKDNLAQSTLECSGFTLAGQITGLAASGQTLWASFSSTNRVRIFEGGVFKRAVDLPNPSGPCGIAIGPEGSAWVAMSQANAVDRIAADGTRTRFPLPAGSEPQDIVLGPDGAFWIAELGSDKIGRMTTAGAVTNEYPVPGHGGELAEVSSITTGPDGALWFTEGGVGKIARLVPDPPAGLSASVSTDTLAPLFIGRPVFSPSRFKVVGKGRARASRSVPSGAKLTFSLSEPATVTATIARKARKRRGGYRYVKVGKLNASGKQGGNAVPFSGKLKGKALAPGKYLATLTARDAAGNVSPPKTAGFAIVR